MCSNLMVQCWLLAIMQHSAKNNNELKKTEFTPSSYLLCFLVPWLGVSADFFELPTEFEAYLLYS